MRQRNALIYLLRACFFSATVQLIPSAVVQSFFIGQGVGLERLGLFGTVNTAVTALGLFLFSGLGDRFGSGRSFRRALSVFGCCYAVNAVALIAVTCLTGVEIGQRYWIYVGATALYSVFSSVYTILDTSTPVRVLSSGARLGRVYGLAGVFSGVVGILCGFAVSAALGSGARNPYALLGVCSLAALLPGVSLSFSFNEAEGASAKPTKPEQPLRVLREVWRIGSFRAMLAPNLLRALQFGGVYYASAIGLQRFSNSAALTGLFAVALPAATLAGCTLITAIEPRFGSGRLLFFGAIASAAGCVGIAFANTVPLYAAAYFLLYFGESFIDYLFPLGSFRVAPAEVVGRFNSIRLLIYMLASSVFIAAVGSLLKSVPAYAVLCGTAAVVLLCGALFARAYGRYASKRD